MSHTFTTQPQHIQGMTHNQAAKGEWCRVAAQYPYFLPTKVVCGLLEDEATALQELPYFYGVNPVILHYLSAKLKEAPAPPEKAPESPAIVGWEAKGAKEALPAETVVVAEPVAAEVSLVEETIEVAESTAPQSEDAEALEIETPIPSEAVEAVVEKAEFPENKALEAAPETIAEAAAADESPSLEPTEMEMVAEAVAEEAAPAADDASEEAGKQPEGTEISGNRPPSENKLHIPQEEPLTEETPEKPAIQPLYTKDYFKHQGVSSSEEENPFELRKPSGNDLMVMRSFGEWLRFFHSKKAKADEEQEDKRALKAMWQKGKLAAALEEEDEEIPEVVFEMAVKSISHEGNPATETMAKIYLAQGKWEKAVGVYEQLQLRNPQKSAYFAEKIAAIEQQHRP